MSDGGELLFRIRNIPVNGRVNLKIQNQGHGKKKPGLHGWLRK